MRIFAMVMVLATGLMGCNQSSIPSKLKLTGMACYARDSIFDACQAGDIIVFEDGWEERYCDWDWQVVHHPEKDETTCVYIGRQRDKRER